MQQNKGRIFGCTILGAPIFLPAPVFSAETL